MMKLTINSKEIEAAAGSTVLEAALAADIYIPNLCYHPDLPPIGACRLCVVEIEGMRGIPPACTTRIREGMVVRTDTPRLQEMRRNIMWLIMSEHPQAAMESSQLQKVADYIGAKEMLSGFKPHSKNIPVISDDPLYIRDVDRCILCGRCVRMCQDVRKAGVLGFVHRGINTIIGTSYGSPLKEAACKFCGACVAVCPSGALQDKDIYDEEDPAKKLLPCANTCPAGIEVDRYVQLIAKGRYQDALEVIREKVPFPTILGYVCDHPCEAECRRGRVNEPVAVRALKRFVAERDTGRWRSKLKIPPDTGKRIAVIGSGPAGLTAAWFLRTLGHAVTVFEALPKAGGMMRNGIPKYRLPWDVLDKEIKEVENIGVVIKTNAEVKSLDALFGEGFHAVFVAVGAKEGTMMDIPGEDDPRVLDGISILKAISTDIEAADLTGEVAVVGGGNVAMDVARSALRVGAKRVTVLYRRTRDEMPAAKEEVEDAIKEGVKFKFLVAPLKVIPTPDKLKLECIRMELGEPDASGRRRPVPVPGSEFTVKADRLIAAIGQKVVVSDEFKPLLNKRGWFESDKETAAAPRPGVFVGGDAVSGPASVIKAIQAGRKAAISIDKYLGGKGEIGQIFVPDEPDDPALGRDEGFGDRKRAKLPSIPVAQRLCSCFPEVEHSLEEDKAVHEAERCLRCQLRLQISEVPMPPE